MKKIAIYGKGGIGKSTTTSNISAALASKGYRVMQIGCDPKADSTRMLMGGKEIPTILNTLRVKGKDLMQLEDILFESYSGVICAECGGPKPGVGCAGRGIITSFELLDSLNAFEIYNPDIVLYDVLGDVVCGGFSMPLRQGYADDVYIVSSGEKMSIFAAGNIGMAITEMNGRSQTMLKGIILNARGVNREREIVSELALDLGTEIVSEIQRDPMVQTSEEKNMTVIECAPQSQLASMYEKLAMKLIGGISE
ncbi:nitrogenase iron protein NifH [uncultured Methanolobus sp.]|uniref:nitrogenase iron protein NifH n=1 Tax=uncultured Methanolobus sp. TaxID=218300 RepID=UPI0029C84FD9|nr:nitrogenase iron protein NifH [uncultured Methanolobus sp.]